MPLFKRRSPTFDNISKKNHRMLSFSIWPSSILVLLWLSRTKLKNVLDEYLTSLMMIEIGLKFADYTWG